MVEAKEPHPVDYKKVIGTTHEPYEVELTNNGAALYSLSIGIQRDPMFTDDLKFTYEADADFQAYPTNALTLCHRGLFTLESKPIPGMKYNPMMLLHGEEKVTFYEPLTPGETYVCEEVIADIKDKKKGAAILLDTKVLEKETRKMCALIRTNVFIRGIGGFGYKGTIKEKIPKPPQTAPDFVGTETMHANAANLYRLNGDKNPLHVDPKMAAVGKFDKPILHGLCTYGMSVRAV